MLLKLPRVSSSWAKAVSDAKELNPEPEPEPEDGGPTMAENKELELAFKEGTGGLHHSSFRRT